MLNFLMCMVCCTSIDIDVRQDDLDDLHDKPVDVDADP